MTQNNTNSFVKDAEIKNFIVEEGIYDHSFKQDDGQDWNVSISIPKIVQGENYPLVLALHWAGNESTYKEFSDCLVFPGFKEMNAIIIAPSSNAGKWFLPENESKVIDFIHKIKMHWPVNCNQVIITGYSNGAIGSWQYLQNNPELFHSAVLMAGNYNDAKIEVPTYVIHGKNDELFLIGVVEHFIKESIAKGSEIKLIKLNNFSHFMACSYKDALKSVVSEVMKEMLKDN